MLEDRKIENLIKLAVIDEDRKQLYLESLPKMTGEEKLQFAIGMWEIWLTRLHQMTRLRMEEMIEEMANQGKEYSHKDFDKVKNQVINEMIHQRVGVEETDQLAELREELAHIHNVVENHSKQLDQINKKLG